MRKVALLLLVFPMTLVFSRVFIEFDVPERLWNFASLGSKRIVYFVSPRLKAEAAEEAKNSVKLSKIEKISADEGEFTEDEWANDAETGAEDRVEAVFERDQKPVPRRTSSH